MALRQMDDRKKGLIFNIERFSIHDSNSQR